MTIPTPNLYGLMIAIGIYLAITISEKAQLKLSRKNSIYQSIQIEKLIVWIALPAILGARAYHVIDFWEYYWLNPQEIIVIWQGGIGIFGAILGGLAGIALYTWKKTPRQTNQLHYFLSITDLASVGIPVAQAIGRLGNYFNQELFGRPTDLPWGIFIDPKNRPPQHLDSSHFHPLFAYESLLNIIVFIILWNTIVTVTNSSKTKNAKDIAITAPPISKYKILGSTLIGIPTAIYLIGYGLIRFCLEYLRIDPWNIGFITTGQLFSLGLITLGILIIQFRRS